ncbi:hypothetical protein [Winogradskyella sp. UBA3174]|uniref:hypothetical protein n=1 Tax=Winogradskyella sp. UBA3174 TaxID=1947785 RepID=UPI0025D0A850|nr:hypothetical protein [Winogradskyella sp. UBA3174]
MKQKLNYLKFLIEIAKYLWPIFNGLVALPYFIAVIAKISRPEVNNLPTDYLIVIGIILLVSIVLNRLWILKLRKSLSN